MYRESLVNLIRQECGNPMFGVEVGVHRGATSAILLRTFPQLVLAMVDLWGEWKDVTPHTLEEQKQFRQQAMASTNFAESRRWIIGEDSAEAASVLLGGWWCPQTHKWDFVFIDADHSYEACRRDLGAWLPVVKTLFCGHDYGKPEFGVTQAVDEFCEEQGMKVNVTEGHIWWVRK